MKETEERQFGKRAAALTIRPSACDFIDRFRTSCPIIRTGVRDVLKGGREYNVAIPACFKDRTPSIGLVERPCRGKEVSGSQTSSRESCKGVSGRLQARCLHGDWRVRSYK